MKKYQKEINDFFEKQGWVYWNQMNQFARLAEETGELARVLNHLYGQKPKKLSEEKQNLEEEIGDIIYTLMCLANSTGIDLDKAISNSIKKVKTRDAKRFVV